MNLIRLPLLLILVVVIAMLLYVAMFIDWICKTLTIPEPFGIIKGIKDLEATDTDAYIN